MTMKERESFKEYAYRWRELVAQVEPPLSEKELTDIFVDTLWDPYFDKLVSSWAYGFADLVAIGDIVEKELKDGKILKNTGAPNTTKKSLEIFRGRKGGKLTSSMLKGENLAKGDQNNIWYTNSWLF